MRRTLIAVAAFTLAFAGIANAENGDVKDDKKITVEQAYNETAGTRESDEISVTEEELTIDSQADAAKKDKSQKKSKAKKDRDLGQLTGSFETNTVLYVNDKVTGERLHPYGSNNYLKLDYQIKGFSVGAQVEWYPQVLNGYNNQLTGLGLPFLYASYQNNFVSATLGSFYEQLGSGLLFRSWEDRTLGSNNAMQGARLTFNIKDIVKIKLFTGTPRINMWPRVNVFYPIGIHSDVPLVSTPDLEMNHSLNSALDVSLSLSDAIGLKDHSISIEGSLLHKYTGISEADQELEELELIDFTIPRNVLSYSVRANYAWNGLNASFEYVGKGKDFVEDPFTIDYALKGGSAILAELGYTYKGLSLNAQFRKMDMMYTPAYRDLNLQQEKAYNVMSYIPALTYQHTYSLFTMHPFGGYADYEIGGQFDVFYNAKRGTALGGKRGLKLHASVAHYKYYETDFKRYTEVNADFEKQWCKWFKTNVFYSYQQLHIEKRHAFALDMLFKINRKYSIRAEYQYLLAPKVAEKDWMAATLEFNVAPSWSVYVSDIWNHGETGNHYYSGGLAFTHSIVRVALSYGRNKAGYICSGGVCRYVPEYTGGNLSVTVRF